MKRLTLISAAGLLLSGCGSVHPGAAAVVDGTTISMDTLDRTASIYCLDASRQAEGQDGGLAGQRGRAAIDLVLQRISADMVAERGLEVDESLAEIPDDALPAIEEAFGDAPDAVDVIGESVELGARFAAIGADVTGEEATDANLQELQSAGYQAVLAEVPDHDVTFDPRLGVDRDAVATGGSGSLSVPTSSDQPGGTALSPALQCSD